MGATDDVVRQREFDRLERAVDELRTQLRDDDRRHAELRDADNARHAAEHDSIDARIDRERERHEQQHEREQNAVQHTREWTWSAKLGLFMAVCALVGAYYEILSHAR